MAVRDHESIILGGIIPERRDLLMSALQQLEPDHFRTEVRRNIFRLLEVYYAQTTGIITRGALSDLLERRGVEATKTLLYEEAFDEAVATTVPDHEFRHAIAYLKDLRAEQRTGEAITTSMEILQRGVDLDGRDLRGHADAREYLYGELGVIDRLGQNDTAPEGDVRGEQEIMMKDYADRKSGQTVPSISSGIRTVDRSTGGFQNGELVLICAHTGEGKSMLSTQVGWNACVNNGKNVFFATSETTRPQVMRRLMARHSRLEQFSLPEGLNSKDIKNGDLDDAQEDVYSEVVRDFTTNPTYGKFYIAQIPRDGTLGFIEARLARQQAMWNIDLVVIDYLTLIRSERRRESIREELNEIVKGAKIIATTFNNGLGVPILSPWQMSTRAWEEAKRVGYYTLGNLAETSEAEKTPDMVLSLLRVPETPSEVKIQFLKNRDGEVPAMFSLEYDYRCAYLGEKSGSSMDALLDDQGEMAI